MTTVKIVQTYGGMCSSSESEAITKVEAAANQRLTVCSKVIIFNELETPLEYVHCGNENGYFHTPIDQIFEREPDGTKVIKPGVSSAFVHSGKTFALVGSRGYISVRIRTQGKNYKVCLGFSSDSARLNRAGVQIRCEDGVTDGAGNIAGHGVDATGRVDDITALVSVYHYQSSHLHSFNEESRSFKVTCNFTNNSSGLFLFRFIKC